MDMIQAKERLDQWYNGEDVDISPELLGKAYKAICSYIDADNDEEIKKSMRLAKARLESWLNGDDVDISPELLDCAYRAIISYKEV